LRLSRERDRSVNTTVLEILSQAVGVDARRERLTKYATWTTEDLAQVEDAVAAQRTIIAAAAIDSGGRLVTFDKDFGRIEALDCTILAS